MDAQQQTQTEATPEAAIRTRPSVLVVDDDQTLRTQISTYLTSRGISCMVAEDGSHAVAALERHQPRIVLLDIRMPDITGIEVAAITADLTPHPKIILMSGYDDAVIEANKANLDVFAVIEKPVPLHVIERFVEQALDSD